REGDREHLVRVDVRLAPAEGDRPQVDGARLFDEVVVLVAQRREVFIANHRQREYEILGREWRAVVPGGAVPQLPGRLHPTVRQKRPQAIRQTRDRLGEKRAKAPILPGGTET